MRQVMRTDEWPVPHDVARTLLSLGIGLGVQRFVVQGRCRSASSPTRSVFSWAFRA